MIIRFGGPENKRTDNKHAQNQYTLDFTRGFPTLWPSNSSVLWWRSLKARIYFEHIVNSKFNTRCCASANPPPTPPTPPPGILVELFLPALWLNLNYNPWNLVASWSVLNILLIWHDCKTIVTAVLYLSHLIVYAVQTMYYVHSLNCKIYIIVIFISQSINFSVQNEDRKS